MYHAMYLTETAERRLQGVGPLCARIGLGIPQISRLTGIGEGSLRLLIRDGRILSCENYLKMGEFLEWDLKRDINYIWYHSLYSADDMRRRLRRLGIVSESNLPAKLRTQLRYLVNFYWSGNIHALEHFGAGMYYIRNREIERGYDDALDLED